MIKKEVQFTVDVFKTIEDLMPADLALLSAARATTQEAYAPYSNFLVGAVAQLSNGAMVKGTNQENASYPVGLFPISKYGYSNDGDQLPSSER